MSGKHQWTETDLVKLLQVLGDRRFSHELKNAFVTVGELELFEPVVAFLKAKAIPSAGILSERDYPTPERDTTSDELCRLHAEREAAASAGQTKAVRALDEQIRDWTVLERFIQS